MKEITITNKYLVFGKEDYEESRKYLNDVAYFDDSFADLEKQLKNPDTEYIFTFEEICITSGGIAYVDSDGESYSFMAVIKPEVIEPKPVTKKSVTKKTNK